MSSGQLAPGEAEVRWRQTMEEGVTRARTLSDKIAFAEEGGRELVDRDTFAQAVKLMRDDLDEVAVENRMRLHVIVGARKGEKS